MKDDLPFEAFFKNSFRCLEFLYFFPQLSTMIIKVWVGWSKPRPLQ